MPNKTAPVIYQPDKILQHKNLRRLGLTGQGILRNNALIADSLGVDFVLLSGQLSDEQMGQIDALAGWGRKASYDKAKRLADKYQKPIITLEDGFLRSIDSGIDSRYALSYIADDVGVYFDLTATSCLELYILDNVAYWNNQKEQTAKRLMDKIIHHKLSKYNHTLVAPDLSAQAGNNKPHLIIIDQVVNDASIVGAGANTDSFFAMLRHAKDNYPNHNIWIKAHPAGRGHFCQKDIEPRFYLDKPCNAIALLSQAEIVYSVSSHMGFEALMLGKTLISFGVAWYSGFGLDDVSHAPQNLLTSVQQRRIKHTPTQTVQANIYQLFYSAYVDYSYYADPASCGIGRTACDIDCAIDWLITNQKYAIRLQGAVLSCDLSFWKSGFVAHFLGTPLTKLTIKPKSAWLGAMPSWVQAYLKNPKRPYKNKRYDFVVAWGLKHAQMLKDTKAYGHLPILCMEDGFVRSRGLGATLLPPLSVVLDGMGIYYDANTPSDLENLLVSANPTADELAKAQALLDKLTTKRITKYNVGKPSSLREEIDKLKKIKGKRQIRLVVGQVEDDASVQNCLSPITTNQALLADVCQRHQGDIIIYKPHPDVEAGLRTGLIDEGTLALADRVAHEIAMPDCLEVCDVVHTISSLTGFEALIRNKQVVCYGLPFYAGFGLTDDIVNDHPLYAKTLARRQRRSMLSLQAMAHTVLIDYPLYRLPNGVGLAQAYQVVDFLAQGVAVAEKKPTKRRLTTYFMQIRHRFLRKFHKASG